MRGRLPVRPHEFLDKRRIVPQRIHLRCSSKSVRIVPTVTVEGGDGTVNGDFTVRFSGGTIRAWCPERPSGVRGSSG